MILPFSLLLNFIILYTFAKVHILLKTYWGYLY